MNCTFCNKPCEELDSSEFRCNPCAANFFFKAIRPGEQKTHTSTRLKRMIGKRTYIAYLLFYCNKTIIDYTEPYPQEFTYGGAEPDIQETILTVDDILPITPENFLNKIKTILVFS